MTKNVMIGLGLAGIAAYFIFRNKKIGVKTGTEQYGPPAPAGVGTQPTWNTDATGNMNGQPSPGTAQTDVNVGAFPGAFVAGEGLAPTDPSYREQYGPPMPLGALGAEVASTGVDPEIVGRGAG